ncbi:MAG: DUF368 domain-containing protein [Calditrichaceae bacterium]
MNLYGEEKSRSLAHNVRLFFVGVAMGIANIIPGVSGGTIAVVFGIYEELMESLGNFLTNREKRWRYIKFLVILFLGSGIAIVVFARLLSWAYQNYEMMTVYFFMGLILGSIPVVIRSHHDMKPNLSRIIVFLAGLILVVILALQQNDPTVAKNAVFDYTAYGLSDYIYYLFSGAVAASAMIIPGISGSFILILLGSYWVVLSSLNDLTTILVESGLTPEMTVRLSILGFLGAGVVIGIFGFSKLMSIALKKAPALTMYAILGLIIGSLYQIYPGFKINMDGFGAIITFTAGILISLKFGEE